uniref:Uncharacterized protein n=1 Tax=Aegilops tauschii subsp. strangulata TaxID=200361 RepID=A0A453G1R7_AEGTS
MCVKLWNMFGGTHVTSSALQVLRFQLALSHSMILPAWLLGLWQLILLVCLLATLCGECGFSFTVVLLSTCWCLGVQSA